MPKLRTKFDMTFFLGDYFKKNSFDKENIFIDFCHLTDKGYEYMAQEISGKI